MPKKIGVSLSGGGYRAAAFHLGTLKKLNELGILSSIHVLSTISGGSITGAAWCLHQGDYPSFHQQMIKDLHEKNVITNVLTSFTFIKAAAFILFFLGVTLYLLFTPYAPWSVLVIAVFIFLFLRYQFQIFPVSRQIEKAYDQFLFHHQTLSQLNDQPILAIGSSNLHTGRPFTFSKTKMSDSTYTHDSEYKPPIYFVPGKFPVSRAVMASSCVPFAFTPVSIDKQFFANPDDFSRIHPQLVDGGVYDNQGIQKLTQPKSYYQCDIIITSDAGGNFRADKKYPNVLALLIRTMDLFMYRIKAFQMAQNVYRNVEGPSRPIAYFSLGWCIKELIPGFINNMIEGTVLQEVMEAHELLPEWIETPKTYKNAIMEHLEKRVNYSSVEKRNLTKEEWLLARTTGTNLTGLSQKRIECLIRHAENLTELQVKLYCPSLIYKHA